MRTYGLTGGIASGKSTVAAMFAALGAPVVDADRLAREVVAPGQPAFAEIVAAFGPELVAADGGLDRKRLGAIVFADPAARLRLNAITHPRIAERSRAALDAIRATGAATALYEAALIVENRLHLGLDGLIVVAAPDAVQLARLVARDGLGEADARARLAAQLPLADKLAVADFVIDNGGSEAATRAQVEALWTRLREAKP